MQKEKHLIFVGITGFPDSPEAPIQRCLHLGAAVQSRGWKVSFLNRLPFRTGSYNKDTTDLFRYRSFYDTKIGRLVCKCLSFLLEPFVIRKLVGNSTKTVLFVYTQFFGMVVYYRIIARIFGLKTCLSYVELRSSIPTRKKPFQKINDYFFDRYAFSFVDAVNPISNSLSKRVSKFYPGKPQILIPCICNFSQFGLRRKELAFEYFLYCGSAGYTEVIMVVIDAYRMLPQRTARLLLIISGSPAGLQKIADYVGKDDNIVIESNIEYERLVNLYSSALALLIPLRPTPQDLNRFPHKISEYTASKRPIITTGVGEVVHYFTDKESAIIADGFAASQLSKAMTWAVENKEQLDQIGINGFLIGLQAFSHMAHRERLEIFLNNI